MIASVAVLSGSRLSVYECRIVYALLVSLHLARVTVTIAKGTYQSSSTASRSLFTPIPYASLSN